MNTNPLTDKLAAMKEGGQKLQSILDELLAKVTIGTTGKDIDNLACTKILEFGGKPSFTMVPGYHWSTCICVNDVVVHGIPTTEPFKAGDIVGIDIGMYYRRFHTDASWSTVITNSHDSVIITKRQEFLRIGKQALTAAIAQARVGNHIGHISSQIQKIIERAGYSVVRALVGHGVGEKLHESPEVPGFLHVPIQKTPPLTDGMTLAIEVIYAQGKSEIAYDNDGWTIRTKDRSLSGLFEKTVSITRDNPIILT